MIQRSKLVASYYANTRDVLFWEYKTIDWGI